MTDPEIRKIIIDALTYASVYRVADTGIAEPFIAGTADMRFDELEMDSLACMELCIALELNAGVSIVPEELDRIATLEGLVRRVQRG